MGWIFVFNLNGRPALGAENTSHKIGRILQNQRHFILRRQCNLGMLVEINSLLRWSSEAEFDTLKPEWH